MKNQSIEIEPTPETIAFFGQAKIISHPDGHFAILGGSFEDRQQAAQWSARFLDVRFSITELIGK